VPEARRRVFVGVEVGLERRGPGLGGGVGEGRVIWWGFVRRRRVRSRGSEVLGRSRRGRRGKGEGRVEGERTDSIPRSRSSPGPHRASGLSRSPEAPLASRTYRRISAVPIPHFASHPISSLLRLSLSPLTNGKPILAS